MPFTQHAPHNQIKLWFLFGRVRFSTVLVSYLVFYSIMPLTMWRNNEKLFVAMTYHNPAIGNRVQFSLGNSKMLSYHSNQPFTFLNKVNLLNNDVFCFPGNSH